MLHDINCYKNKEITQVLSTGIEPLTWVPKLYNIVDNSVSYLPIPEITTKSPIIGEYSNLTSKDYRPNNPYLINKIICEKNLVFSQPKSLFLYYDIETFCSNFHNVPQYTDYNARISIVSIVNTRDQLCVVYVNGNTEGVTEERIKLFLPKLQEYQIKVTGFNSEKQLCRSFFDYITSYREITIVGSFNGSLGLEDLPGYDLPFLWTRAEYAQGTWKLITKKGFRDLSYHYNFNTITQIDEIPHVYFYDYRYIFTIVDAKEQAKMGYSLSDYLKHYKLDPKLDEDFTKFEMQEELYNAYQGKGVDNLSKYIAYCIMDSYLLHCLEDKSSLVLSKLAMMEICNIPLHMALYYSSGRQSMSALVQRYYKRGYLLRQCNQKKEFATFSGGLNEAYSGVYSNVLDADVTSMYPNIIISYNISPETLRLIDDGNSHEIHLDSNTEIGKKHPVVYFTKSVQGCVPEFSSELLNLKTFTETERKRYHKDSEEYKAIDRKRTQYKLGVNTIFGSLASEHTPIFSQLCAAAVTSMGRRIITQVKEWFEQQGAKIISINTDGICVKLNDYSILEKHESEMDPGNLLELHSPTLDEKLRKFCELTFKTDRFEFKYEGVYRMYIPKVKKSYLFIKYDNPLDLTKENPRININEFDINGIQWSKYPTPESQEWIRSFFRDVLLQQMNDDAIRNHLRKFMTYHLKQVQSSVSNIDILKHYSKLIKLTSKTGVYLRNKFNLLGDRDYFVEINNGEKRKINQLTPLSLVVRNKHLLKHINILTMITTLTSQIKSFFVEPDSADLLQWKHGLKVELEDNELRVRFDIPNGKPIFKDMYIEDIITMSREDKVSIHEVIVDSINHPYFDIDDEDLTFDLLHFTAYLNRIFPECRICIAEASSEEKLSYHIVIPTITIHLEYNSIIARNYNHMTGMNYCDTNVYSMSKSLRMPLSYKLKDNKYIRELRPINGCSFEDLIIRNINEAELVETPFYYQDRQIFDLPYLCQVVNNQFKSVVMKFIDDNNMEYKSEQKFIIIARFKGSCILCQRTHEHDNQYFYQTKNKLMLGCYRNNADNDKKLDHLVYTFSTSESTFTSRMTDMYNKVKGYSPSYVEEYQDQKYVDFDVHLTKHTYIISALGTGKTECLLNQLDKDSNILVITFRRTFASDFTRRMNSMGIETINYLDEAKRSYTTSKYPRLCLQIDSIEKYRRDGLIKYLICDEIESILSQLHMSKNFNTNVELFWKIVESAQHCIFMDGHMQKSTTEFVQMMTSNPSYRCIRNLYKPKTDYKCIIRHISSQGRSAYEMCSQVIGYLRNNEKVAVMCSAETHAMGIYNCATELIKGIKIKIYTGKDHDVNDSGKSQRRIKREDFSEGINKVISEYQPQLLIYTSTMTSGVSIDIDYFDRFVGCLFSKTCDVLSFVQSVHRIRHIRSKTLEIYYNNIQEYKPVTMYQYNHLVKMEDIPHDYRTTISELFLTVRNNAMQVYRGDIFLLMLDTMGYEVSFEELTNRDLEGFTPEEYKTAVDSSAEKKQLKNILEKYIANPNSCKLIRLTPEEYKAYTNSDQFDKLAETNQDPHIYVKALFAEICKYALFPVELITNPLQLETVTHANRLLTILTNLSNTKNWFYSYIQTNVENYNESVYLKKLDDMLLEHKLCKSIKAVPASTTKVVDYTTQVREATQAKDLIEKLNLGRPVLRDEFEQIVQDWSVRNNIEYVSNNMMLTKINNIISLFGFVVENDRRRVNGDRVRVYTLKQINSR